MSDSQILPTNLRTIKVSVDPSKPKEESRVRLESAIHLQFNGKYSTYTHGPSVGDLGGSS